MPEQRTQAPSPAPDLIPAETQKSTRPLTPRLVQRTGALQDGRLECDRLPILCYSFGPRRRSSGSQGHGGTFCDVEVERFVPKLFRAVCHFLGTLSGVRLLAWGCDLTQIHITCALCRLGFSTATAFDSLAWRNFHEKFPPRQHASPRIWCTGSHEAPPKEE